MALVDYSSDDSSQSHSIPESPPSKRLKTAPTSTSSATNPRECGAGNSISNTRTRGGTSATTTRWNNTERNGTGSSGKSSAADADAAALPPLPEAFHDLYAHTVRTSNVDDPTLHQGRRRLVPHVAGNWPSHVYIEWHPTPTQSTYLTTLVSSLAVTTLPQLNSTIHPLLTSPLGVPLPLHISLSRPLTLTTTSKDSFLRDITETISTTPLLAPFELQFCDLNWHHARESDRTFLVLRVRGVAATSPATASPTPVPAAATTTMATAGAVGEQGGGNGEGGVGGGAGSVKKEGGQKNKHLTTLLLKTNALVQTYSQLPLYASRGEAAMADAFHVSIAWASTSTSTSISTSTPAATTTTASDGRGYSDGDGDSDADRGGGGVTEEMKEAAREAFSKAGGVKGIRLVVDGVKVKIGNVVTHVSVGGRKGTDEGGDKLLGLF